MDQEKENEYVTHGSLNQVIHEVKNEMQDMDRKHERLYLELKHSTETLNNTIANLNENIKTQTKMMHDNIEESKLIRKEIVEIQKENISTNHRLSSLEDFQKDTSEENSEKTKEVLKIFSIAAGSLTSVMVAVIQVSHHFFS